MQEYFVIRTSRAQLALLVAAHCLLVAAIAVYVEPLTLKLPAMMLLGLLGLRESLRLARQRRLLLHCNPRTAEIALQCGEQPYFYAKNKVYATRWFAILKLVNDDDYRTLILDPDCFDSAASYHRLRYLLCRLEQSRAG